MARTGGDILVETLLEWGVDTIFGMPGDGINGLMEAIRKREGQVRFIQVRHEESAALMACASHTSFCRFAGSISWRCASVSLSYFGLL